MWRTMTYATFFVCLLFLASVKGSCLEYGHSCWGAHGKRSGGTGSGKILRGTTNLRHDELLLNDDNANRLLSNKPLYDNFDEMNNSAENAPHTASSNENNAPTDANESAKMRNFLGQRRAKFLLHSVNSKNNNNNNNNNIEDSTEHRQQQRQLQRAGAHWRKLPLFQLKPSFGNAPPPYEQLALTGGDTRADDAAVYYDFK